MRNFLIMSLLAGLAVLVASPCGADAPGDPVPGSRRQLASLAEHLHDMDLLGGLGLGAAGAALFTPRDEAWTRWFVKQEPLGPDGRDIGYELGHRRMVAGVSVALTAGGLLAGSSHLRDSGLLVLEANLLSAGLVTALKEISGRERPDGSNHLSFPSGHATSSWTTATVLRLRFGWWVGVPAYGAALYTGLSRIQGNKHHPSDILFGMALSHWIASAVCRSARSEPGSGDPVGLQWMPPPAPGEPGLAFLRARW